MIRVELNISSISLIALALFIFPLASGILSIYLASHTYEASLINILPSAAVCGAFLCANSILLFSNAFFPLRSPVLVTQFLSVVGAFVTGSLYICKRISFLRQSHDNYEHGRPAMESAFLILWVISLCVNSSFLTSAAIIYQGQLSSSKSAKLSPGIVEKQSIPLSFDSMHTLIGKNDIGKVDFSRLTATRDFIAQANFPKSEHDAQTSSVGNTDSSPDLTGTENGPPIVRTKRKHKAAASVLSFLQSPPATALLKPSIRASRIPDAKLSQSEIEELGIPIGHDSTAAFDTWDVQSRDRVQWTMAHLGIGEGHRNISANSSAGQSDISNSSFNRRISNAGFAKEYRVKHGKKEQVPHKIFHKPHGSISQYDQEALSSL